ncbi:hypothetical protein CASFOL_027183 [Castilleja foliolosa]|uniref:t-SNARE coiled-coil homology domain-containing protein n=1 Tax=Castilleja foliolosa TaxID=1961234 RepID=A0ABD3CEZ1_9LAMI
MNDLLSDSFSAAQSPPDSHTIEMTNSGANLDRFFQDVEATKTELQNLETLYNHLQSSHEQSKTLHTSKAIKDLRSNMDSDVSASLKKAKLIKSHLDSLEKSNSLNRALPGCGPGSSSDRTRTSILNGLIKNLHSKMTKFNELRQRMRSEHRETMQRRYFTVTGENPDERVLDHLIETGESETFLEKAIREQGRGQVMDTIVEIRERYDAVRDMERSLKELHEVFMDMAVLVESQGEQLDDIESQVNRANSFVRDGTSQLVVARRHQKSTRKWTCWAILILLIIILIVVLSLRPWR